MKTLPWEMHTDNFKGKQAINVLNDRINWSIDAQLKTFSKRWCVLLSDLQYFAYSWREGENINLKNDFERYKANGGELSKLKYLKTVRQEASSLILNDIRPLIIR